MQFRNSDNFAWCAGQARKLWEWEMGNGNENYWEM